jgi:hypothetical protein
MGPTVSVRERERGRTGSGFETAGLWAGSCSGPICFPWPFSILTIHFSFFFSVLLRKFCKTIFKIDFK